MNFFQNTSKESLLTWISTSSEGDIAGWIDRVIRGIPEAIPIDLRMDLSAADIVQDIFQAISIVEDKNKLWFGIAWLAQQKSWSSYDYFYLETLLTIIARIRAITTLGLLMKLASREILKDRKSPYGATLHTSLLIALASFSCNDQIASIFKRDIQNPEYAAISFRNLWAFDPNIGTDIGYMICRFGLDEKLPFFPAENLFREFSQRNTLETIWILIDKNVRSEQLKNEEKLSFIKMVRSGNLGFILSEKSSNIKLIRNKNNELEEYPIAMNNVPHLLFRLILAKWNDTFPSADKIIFNDKWDSPFNVDLSSIGIDSLSKPFNKGANIPL